MPLPSLTDEEILAANIIGELGLEALPEERRISIVNKMADLVQQRVMIQIAEKLSDKDAEELQKIITEKGESDAAVAEFIHAKIPNMPNILREELVNVKKELIAHMSTSDN